MKMESILYFWGMLPGMSCVLRRNWCWTSWREIHVLHKSSVSLKRPYLEPAQFVSTLMILFSLRKRGVSIKRNANQLHSVPHKKAPRSNRGASFILYVTYNHTSWFSFVQTYSISILLSINMKAISNPGDLPWYNMNTNEYGNYSSRTHRIYTKWTSAWYSNADHNRDTP